MKLWCSQVVDRLGLVHHHCESCHDDADHGDEMCTHEDGDDSIEVCCDVHWALDEIGLPEAWRRLRAVPTPEPVKLIEAPEAWPSFAELMAETDRRIAEACALPASMVSGPSGVAVARVDEPRRLGYRGPGSSVPPAEDDPESIDPEDAPLSG